MLKRFVNDESGATAIEYGLIAALIGVAIIVSVDLVGQELANVFGDVKVGLENKPAPDPDA